MSRSLRKKYSTKLEEDFPTQMKLVIGDEEVVYEQLPSNVYGDDLRWFL